MPWLMTLPADKIEVKSHSIPITLLVKYAFYFLGNVFFLIHSMRIEQGFGVLIMASQVISLVVTEIKNLTSTMCLCIKSWYRDSLGTCCNLAKIFHVLVVSLLI